MSADTLERFITTIERVSGATFETGPDPEPDDLLNPCLCGHPKSFHAAHLGCSGSHHDSRPCATYQA